MFSSHALEGLAFLIFWAGECLLVVDEISRRQRMQTSIPVTAEDMDDIVAEAIDVATSMDDFDKSAYLTNSANTERAND